MGPGRSRGLGREIAMAERTIHFDNAREAQDVTGLREAYLPTQLWRADAERTAAALGMAPAAAGE